MPYDKQGVRSDPEIMLEHRGVTVYRLYYNDNVAAPMRFWFTIDPTDTGFDAGDQHTETFDVRGFSNTATLRACKAQAAASGEPLDLFLTDEVIRQILREDIDLGGFGPVS